MDPAYLLLCGLATLIEPVVSVDQLHQFPPPQVAEYHRHAARHALGIIRARESVEPHRALWWWEARCEAAAVLDAWERLTEAHSPHGPPEARLEALQRLRCILGWRRFCAGRMPCPVPFWAFPAVVDSVPGAHVPVAAWVTQ